MENSATIYIIFDKSPVQSSGFSSIVLHFAGPGQRKNHMSIKSLNLNYLPGHPKSKLTCSNIINSYI
jgi:hypothetical protein